jgi:hypothetical protein
MYARGLSLLENLIFIVVCTLIFDMGEIKFPQLLNVHDVSDVRQIEIHTAEPLVPGPSHLEGEISIAKLKSINLQAVIKFRQNCIKQEVKH